MATGRVRVVDKGAKRIVDMVRRATPPAVRVGVFGDAAAQRYEDTGATVGDIANAHEFGAGVPQRSWLRSTIDTNRLVITRNLRRAAEQVYRGRMKEFQALELLGFSVQGMIQQRIASGIAPALSPQYLVRKLKRYPGASTPLIASGQFRGSVSFALEGRAAQQKSAAVKKASTGAKRAERSKNTRQRQIKKVRRTLRKGLRAAVKNIKKQAKLGKKVLRKSTKVGKKGFRFVRKGARTTRRVIKRGLKIKKRKK